MSEVVIRRAGDGDIRSLAGLYREWDEASPDPAYLQNFRDWYVEESSHHLFLLAEVDGTAVGFVDLAVLVRRPRAGHAPIRWGYLDGAFVRDSCRCQGIGTKLLAALDDQVARGNITHVMLHPTQRSIPLYERAGYRTMPADPKPRMLKTVDAQV